LFVATGFAQVGHHGSLVGRGSPRSEFKWDTRRRLSSLASAFQRSARSPRSRSPRFSPNALAESTAGSRHRTRRAADSPRQPTRPTLAIRARFSAGVSSRYSGGQRGIVRSPRTSRGQSSSWSRPARRCGSCSRPQRRRASPANRGRASPRVEHGPGIPPGRCHVIAMFSARERSCPSPGGPAMISRRRPASPQRSNPDRRIRSSPRHSAVRRARLEQLWMRSTPRVSSGSRRTNPGPIAGALLSRRCGTPCPRLVRICLASRPCGSSAGPPHISPTVTRRRSTARCARFQHNGGVGRVRACSRQRVKVRRPTRRRCRHETCRDSETRVTVSARLVWFRSACESDGRSAVVVPVRKSSALIRIERSGPGRVSSSSRPARTVRHRPNAVACAAPPLRVDGRRNHTDVGLRTLRRIRQHSE